MEPITIPEPQPLELPRTELGTLVVRPDRNLAALICARDCNLSPEAIPVRAVVSSERVSMTLTALAGGDLTGNIRLIPADPRDVGTLHALFEGERVVVTLDERSPGAVAA